ncbi:17303_t:CDS:1, partial [Racocetra fulgida]
TLEDIFWVTVDKTLDVENLKTEIKSTRPNLFQKDFDLYKVDFFQPNRSLISSVNSRNDKGEFIRSNKKISEYFNNGYINDHQYSENGSIHLLIFPKEG